jgi:hypothetical protein
MASVEDADGEPLAYDMQDEYDVSTSFASVAFA